MDIQHNTSNAVTAAAVDIPQTQSPVRKDGVQNVVNNSPPKDNENNNSMQLFLHQSYWNYNEMLFTALLKYR
jgi:hypothetical protein